jgi:hypothetical protein
LVKFTTTGRDRWALEGPSVLRTGTVGGSLKGGSWKGMSLVHLKNSSSLIEGVALKVGPRCKDFAARGGAEAAHVFKWLRAAGR